MKPNQIKKIIKPIVKECINEILLQEGVLSSVISEVVKGLQTTIVESNKNDQNAARLLALEEEYEAERQERIKRLNESVGGNVFSGVTPTDDPDSGAQHSPLSGMRPNDKGINIDGIMALAGKKWKRFTK